MQKSSPSLFIGWLLLAFFAATKVLAGVAYQDPPGGWTYLYNGDQLMIGAEGSGFTSLDGTWSHDNGSDQWDGSTNSGTFSGGSGFGVSNGPGGTDLVTENGVGYLHMQDTGDPRDYGDFPDPSNRKIYFAHDVEADGGGADIMDSGVALTFRARIPTPSNTKVPMDPLHRDGQQAAGVQPYPPEGDGYVTSDGGKGNFVIRQASGGAIAFSLTQTNDTTGGNPNVNRANFAGLTMNEFSGNQVSGNVNFGQGTGTNVIAFDPTQWHEFWIVIRKDPANVGTHQGFIYRDGSLTPHVFRITAGDGNDYAQSYIAFGGTATPQNWALDVDFFGYKIGAEFPPGAFDNLPPDISNVAPGRNATFHPPTNGISLSVTTQGTNSLPPNGFKMSLRGVDVSGGLNITGTAQSRSVTYTNLIANTIYQGEIIVSDQAGRSATNQFSFDTFVESSGVLVEAEDYNHSSGQFADNPVPAGYFGFVGTPMVDYFDTTDTSFGTYRDSDAVDTQAGTDTVRAKYIAAAANDYDVGLVDAGEWLNYTRTFPAGNYNAFLRASATAPQQLLLDRVTGDRTQPNQTTVSLGRFSIVASGRLNIYGYTQLSDTFGAPLRVDLSGVQTLRLTAPNATNDVQANYIFFAPPSETGPPRITSATINNGMVTIQWSNSGTLQSTSNLNPPVTWTDLESDGSFTEPATGTKFYRVKR